MSLPDWCLSSKFAVPSGPRHSVERTAALDRLEDVLTRRLAVVCAPPGYGKSTLLAQFHQRLRRRRIASGWLNLDRDDAEPARILACIVFALVNEVHALRKLRAAAGEHFRGVGGENVVSVIGGALARSAHDVVLFLDDFDTPAGDALCRLVETLVRETPAYLHIVLACRSQPQLPLAAMAASGTLVSLESGQLRFDSDEARLLVASRAGGAEELPRLDELLQRTEGWPLALQLTLALGGKQHTRVLDGAELLPSTALTDYLLDQVFLRLDDDERHVLLLTSVVERFNGDLANELCGRTDGWQIIERLEKHGLFVVPVDANRLWFRYHLLFRDFLLTRLKHDAQFSVPELHARAARWFAAQGDLDSAQVHFIACGDYEQLADLLETAGNWVVRLSTGDLSWPRRVFARLPGRCVESRPRLYIAQAICGVKSGGAVDLPGVIRRAQELMQETGGRTLDSDWETRVLVFMLRLGYIDEPVDADEVEGLIALAFRPPAAPDQVLATLYTGLFMYYLDRGNFAEAVAAIGLASRYYTSAGAHHCLRWLEIHTAQTYDAQGRTADAHSLLQGLDAELLELFGPVTDLGAIVRTLEASLCYEENRLAEARPLLDDGFTRVLGGEGWFNIYALGFRASAGLAAAEYGPDAALDVLAQGDAFARRRSLFRLLRFLALQRARQLALAQRFSEAATALNSAVDEDYLRRERGDPRLRWQSWDSEQAIRARLLIAERRSQEALQLLVPLCEQMRRYRCLRQLIGGGNLVALAHRAAGDPALAVAEVARSLALAEPAGFRRLFLDEGEPLLELVGDTLKQRTDLGERVRVFAASLLEAGTQRVDATPAVSSTGPRSDVSAREREVLGLIGAGLSNKEIAAGLDLSESTVKFHRRNIYRKLNVSSRSKAVAAGRRLGLLA
jgi:LuxR family maltose regulon positive regulatory protein